MKTRLPNAKTLATALVLFGLAAGAPSPALADDTADFGPGNCQMQGGGPGRHAGFGGGHFGGGRMGMMGGDHLPPFLRGLDLTEVQRDKIFELHHAQQPRERELMKAVRSSRDALHALRSTEGFDARQARQLADSHGKAIAELALLHAETGAKVRALLTPEQRKEMDERREKFERRRFDGFRPA